MDVEHDLFRITVAEKDAPTVDALFAVIRDLNYTPSMAAADGFRPGARQSHPAGDAPDVVKQALAKAKLEGKRFVLVDCMGDN
jgi:hypothetical protein